MPGIDSGDGMVIRKLFRFRWPALMIGLVLLSSCKKQDGSQTSSPGGEEKTKIGFVVKQPEEPWFQLEWKFAQQAADKDGFELIKIAAPDGEKALGAIDNLAAGGAQGFVICTPDVKLGPAIVAKAQSHDLKVIAVDDQFIGSDGKPMTDVPYLGISARKIGQSVGQAVINEVKKRNWSQDDTAICVITFDELDTARERTEGAIDAIKAAAFPDSQIFKAPQ